MAVKKGGVRKVDPRRAQLGILTSTAHGGCVEAVIDKTSGLKRTVE